MKDKLSTVNIEDIIDRVAADPAKANDAKQAIRKMITANEPAKPFSHRRPRRRVAEIDDDLFDNMPV